MNMLFMIDSYKFLNDGNPWFQSGDEIIAVVHQPADLEILSKKKSQLFRCLNEVCGKKLLLFDHIQIRDKPLTSVGSSWYIASFL